MKVLDLFCGLGGWSKGFHAEGFEVLGVDIVNVGYPYDLLLQDVRTLNGARFKGFDVIVGSPPCREFSIAGKLFRARWWKNPPNPEKGMELINAFTQVVEEAEPHYWLMENVPGVIPYFKPPKCVTYLARNMRRCFWGDFPPFLVSMDLRRPLSHEIEGRYRSWRRAEIPFPVAKAAAEAMRDGLLLEVPCL